MAPLVPRGAPLLVPRGALVSRMVVPQPVLRVAPLVHRVESGATPVAAVRAAAPVPPYHQSVEPRALRPTPQRTGWRNAPTEVIPVRNAVRKQCAKTAPGRSR